MRGGSRLTTNKQTDEYIDPWIEVANLTDFITQQGSGSSATDIKIQDIHRYLRNPQNHLPQIRNTSRYLTKKHGVLNDVLRMVKSLPNLKYSLSWMNYSGKSRDPEYEKKIHDFLRGINVVKVLRDGLYETAKLGTVVTCLRSNKYVQFLDIDEVEIKRKRNDRWIVEYDLKSLDSYRDHSARVSMINSLPPEVTVAKYNSYKRSGSDSDRFIELANCDVVNIDAPRNSPYGFPMTMGAWMSIMQKELIDRVERSVSDRMIKQVLILYASHIDREKERPVPKEVLTAYFREVSNLVEKKSNGRSTGNTSDSAGTGTIALPHFLELEALKVDTTMFKEELYQKIDNDIYANLGVSPALIYGGGGNYASANVNSEKTFSFIATIIEQFEFIINGYLDSLLPDHLSCEIKFDRSTVLDKQTEIDNKKELYLQTSLITPWIEAVMDVPIADIISQREHEESLGLGELFYPAKNAYTSTSNDDDNTKEGIDIDNESTLKTKTDNGNNTPSPSD